jgi:hypothetical protein
MLGRESLAVPDGIGLEAIVPAEVLVGLNTTLVRAPQDLLS